MNTLKGMITIKILFFDSLFVIGVLILLYVLFELNVLLFLATLGILLIAASVIFSPDKGDEET